MLLVSRFCYSSRVLLRLNLALIFASFFLLPRCSEGISFESTLSYDGNTGYNTCYIDKVYPSSGPRRGGTNLTIYFLQSSFSNRLSQLSVQVGSDSLTTVITDPSCFRVSDNYNLQNCSLHLTTNSTPSMKSVNVYIVECISVRLFQYYDEVEMSLQLEPQTNLIRSGGVPLYFSFNNTTLLEYNYMKVYFTPNMSQLN